MNNIRIPVERGLLYTNLVWCHVKIDLRRTSWSGLVAFILIDGLTRQNEFRQLAYTSIEVSHGL